MADPTVSAHRPDDDTAARVSDRAEMPARVRLAFVLAWLMAAMALGWMVRADSMDSGAKFVSLLYAVLLIAWGWRLRQQRRDALALCAATWLLLGLSAALGLSYFGISWTMGVLTILSISAWRQLR